MRKVGALTRASMTCLCWGQKHPPLQTPEELRPAVTWTPWPCFWLEAPPAPHRPRLPSAESLSRRPLPALPVPEGPSLSPAPSPAPGRKGSIQDRPLPPPPPCLPGYRGPKVEGDTEGGEVEDDPAGHHNEYEGIPVAEEYDYVHLKVSLPGSSPLEMPLGEPRGVGGGLGPKGRPSFSSHLPLFTGPTPYGLGSQNLATPLVAVSHSSL